MATTWRYIPIFPSIFEFGKTVLEVVASSARLPINREALALVSLAVFLVSESHAGPGTGADNLTGTPDAAQRWIERGQTHLENGQSRAARKCFETAVQERLDAFGVNDTRSAEAIVELGVAEYELGDFARSDSLLTLAYGVFQQCVPQCASSLCEVMTDFAEVRRKRARYGEAEELFLRALAVADSTPKLDEVVRAALLNNFAGPTQRARRRISSLITCKRICGRSTRSKCPCSTGRCFRSASFACRPRSTITPTNITSSRTRW